MSIFKSLFKKSNSEDTDSTNIPGVVSSLIQLHILTECFPHSRQSDLEKYTSHFKHLFELYSVNTPERMAAFLSQCSHESGYFKRTVENLNYSAKGLMATWKRHFPDMNTAMKYQRKPELIANRAYANRMGNGPESSGDGWKYRGRGLIQLTGKNNYQALTNWYKKENFVEDPDKLLEPKYVVLSAIWFWTTNGLNSLADKEDVLSITKRINGGTHGLPDRKNQYEKTISVFKKYLNT